MTKRCCHLSGIIDASTTNCETEILAAVDRVFKSGQLILGPEGIAFERDMAAYVGVSGGVGVNSGTDAVYHCAGGGGCYGRR